MKTKTKALLLALCAILLVVASVFGTMAFLTDTQTVENTFTVGQVHIKLDEAKVNAEGKPLNTSGAVVDDLANAARVSTAKGVATPAGNAYHLLPGQEYTKDPTVTVVGGSEDAYVRIIVTVNNISGVKAAFPSLVTDSKFVFTNFITDYDSNTWINKGCTEDSNSNTAVYEFRYKNKVEKSDTDTKLEALFTGISIPTTSDNDDIAKLYYQIDGNNALVYDNNGALIALDAEYQFKITVVANAIQATGFNDADAAWTAFTSQHPNP